MPASIRYSPTRPKQFPFRISNSIGVGVGYRSLHWHKEMEICYIKKGTGKYLINGREFAFEKGDVFLINNDEIHLAFDDQDLIMQVVTFDPSMIWSCGTYILDYEYLKPFLRTESNFCNKLEHTHEKIGLIVDVLNETQNIQEFIGSSD